MTALVGCLVANRVSYLVVEPCNRSHAWWSPTGTKLRKHYDNRLITCDSCVQRNRMPELDNMAKRESTKYLIIGN